MADVVSISSASGSATGDDILVVDDFNMPTDPEMQAVMERFDTSVTLDPDVDISIADEDSIASSSIDRDNESIGAASSNSGTVSDTSATPVNGNSEQEQFFFGTDAINPSLGSDAKPVIDGTKSKIRKGSKDSSQGKEVKKKRSPLEMLKKLTKFDKPKQKHFPSEFAQIRIDRLPQVFVVKYLGKKEISGLYGLHHVRKPVDEFMIKLKKGVEAREKVELPLVYLVVSPKGIDIREHKLNKVEGVAPYGAVAIDFISYGVQDIKYWRIFVYIVVKELSSRSKRTELHAVLCDSSLNARRLALSLGGAFRLYTKNLSTSGKSHNFQVELRPPDELAESLTKECDA
ncbi:hypothetical protein LOTGIDRAFT_233914 [Lottia gigantea]|uniref:PID domain-containing protein n=1 Tax=Lottia gigantea TaxID=225164 RepID=V3ZFY1_LOTGI|nr:hypothetical protein LOTGIDRAFT_233914 [Lottia gigantea]ESO90108.1 hypothetical protein LOTGIDRAFT_233914 [Lottia gigantea]